MLGVAPNPTDGFCRVTGVSGSGVVRIIDALGSVRSVARFTALDPVMDLSRLATGTYVIEVSTGSGVFRGRVIRK